MKRILILGIVFLSTLSAFAQSPKKMSYQAVVTNDSNKLVSNRVIGIRVSIFQGAPTGTAIFIETHAPTSDANGLVDIEIGNGTPVSGLIQNINWENGPFYLRTRIDPNGGINYTFSGTTEILSVPYAMHANTADTLLSPISESDPIFNNSVSFGITGIDTSYWNNKQDKLIAGNGISIRGNTVSKKIASFYLGQDTLGGIVFFIYLDKHKQQHGLIVSKTESAALAWADNSSSAVNADKTSDGAYNTNLMPTSPGKAKNWVYSLGSGWYLPSIDELSLLWRNRYYVNNSNAGGLTLLSTTQEYWSSTEFRTLGTALSFDFRQGDFSPYQKTRTFFCRGVKSF